MTVLDLPAGLIRYLQIRDRQRAEAVSRTLAAMTERERALVREAAVMAFVLGSRHGAACGLNGAIPPDSQVLSQVIGACQGMPDLYTVIASLTSDGQE